MQIKVTKGHKVLITLTAVALVLKVAALVSPGWMRIAWYVKSPMMIDNGGIGPRPMEVQDDEPIAMAKRSAEHPDNNQVSDGGSSSEESSEEEHHGKHHKHHHKHHHHHHHKLEVGEKMVSLSAGLFFFRACVHQRTMEEEMTCKCQYVFYCHAKKHQMEMPQEMKGVGLENIYENAGKYANYGLLEFRVMMVLGVIATFIALISGVRYVRNYFERRKAGVTTVIFHTIAGVLIAVVVGKVVVSVVQLHFLLESMYDYDTEMLRMHFPYALLMAGIGGVITLISAFFMLCTLSKGARYSLAMPYVQSQKAGNGFGVISPPGYEPFYGLTDKKELIKNEECAPQLPEKEPIA